MSRFLRGIFVGIGISLFSALVIALTRSEKLRQELGKRFEVLRKARPSSEQLKQSARQAGTKVRETRKVLSHLMPQSLRRVTQRRQKSGSLAEPSAPSVAQSEQDGSKKPDQERLHTLMTPGAE